jgi:hypothetical protein
MSTLKVTAIRHASASSDAITVAADGSVNVNAPGGMMFRNKIVNGGFDIWQRGTTVSTSVNGWTADRFFNTNSAMTWTRANNTLGGPCPYMCTLTGGGSDSRFRFSFEMPSTTSQGEFAIDSYWTLSLYTDFNIAGRTFNIGYAANPNGTTDTASTTGTWVALGGNRYSVTMQINAANTNNRAAMRFSGPFNGPVNEGVASISVTGVQFEAGSVATPFERRPIAVELAMCQRYYYQSPDYASSSLSYTNPDFLVYGALVGANNWQWAHTRLPVQMRVAPSITTSDDAGNTGKLTIFTSAGGSVTNNVTPYTVYSSVNSYNVSVYTESKYGFYGAISASAEL